MNTVRESVIYRFGEFEAHPDSGELFKGGTKVVIQDLPFRLLIVLIEHAGQVVTRDEIQSRIWSANTFVDFESGLRVAVRKLREALGDSADTPRFIETVPKRGHRFLSPVTLVRREADAPRDGSHASSPPGARRRFVVVGALLLIVVGTLLTLSAVREHAPTAATVIVSDFANSTGDSVFDDALRQGVTVALAQSRTLSVLSEERIQRTLRLMGRTGAERLTPSVALDLCRRTASDAVLDGSIGKVGSQYVLALRATGCRNGDVLDEQQVQAARKEDVLPALDRIARRFRTRLGGTAASGVRADLPLADATTSSLEAWKAYSTGWRVSTSRGAAAAIPFFKRAVELDPKFAMAYAALGLEYSTEGEPTLASENTARAYELRDRVSDAERFFITAYYDGRVTGNQEKARQTCETWAQLFPRDPTPHEMLSGFVDVGLGRLESARDEARIALDLNPDAEITHVHLGRLGLYLGQPDETERVLRRAAERQLESPLIAVLRYELAFYRGDTARMTAEAAAAATQSEPDDWMSQRRAFVSAYGGRMREAANLAGRATAIAAEAGEPERAALFATPVALWQAWSGDSASARRTATSVLADTRSREVQFGAALALAIAGEPAEATRLADDLAARFPEDTGVRFTYAPTIRAAASLARHDPAKALEQLELSRAYELALPRSRIQAFFGALYPTFVRGEAYLAAGRGVEAAAEFQRVVDHRGIVLSDPIGAFAHLGLGRAYAAAGDVERARAAYRDFLAIWKDADADAPILQQARTEYAKLTR